MFVLVIIMLSGGASSSNIDHIEFQNYDLCSRAANTIKANNEVKSVYCVRKSL